MSGAFPSEIEEGLRQALAPIADVLELRLLSPEQRQRIRELERHAEEAGAAGGMAAFCSEGVWKVLEAELLFAVLTGPMREDTPHSWTLMVDENDRVIGEWLPLQRRDEARDEHCTFISADFVLYRDRISKGPSRFVTPFIPLGQPHPQDETAGAPSETFGAACPSGPTDVYLRSLFGNPGGEAATLLGGVMSGIDKDAGTTGTAKPWVGKLDELVEFARDGIVSKSLLDEPRTKVVLFAMVSGQALSEHTASMPASIHVLSGRGIIRLGAESHEAGPGTYVYMPANQNHAVVAEDDMVFLLTLFKDQS